MWWRHLRNRTPIGMGASGISYSEIGAWKRESGIQTCHYEIDLVVAIDDEYLQWHAERSRARDQKTERRSRK